MVVRYSMTTRARARAAMRSMAADAQGPRLRSRWRRISAGRITHICLRTVEFVAALFIVGGLALASLLGARAASAGRHARPDPNLAPGARRRPLRHRSRPDLSHAQFVGRGSRVQGPDGARRRWPNGPFGAERQTRPRSVRARRCSTSGCGGLNSTGSTCACASPPTARSRLRSRAIRARPRSLCPARPPRAEAVAGLAALVRAAAEAMAGATQALDRLTLANGHFEIDNEATQRSVVYNDFAVTFDHSGSRAHATISATGPAGPWTIAAQASDGDAPTLSVQGARSQPRRPSGVRQEASAPDRRGADRVQARRRAHARVGAARVHRPVHRRRRTRAHQQPRRGAVFHRRGERRHGLG